MDKSKLISELLLFLIIIIFLSACHKSDQKKIDMGFEYFPTAEGYWQIYQVDSIVIEKSFNVQDTFRYQVKNLVNGVYIDSEGRRNQTVKRFLRNNIDDPWHLNRVDYQILVDSRMEKVENNRRTIVMVFPVKDSYSWLGNAYQMEAPTSACNSTSVNEWQFEALNTHSSNQINDVVFDSTVTITHINSCNLVCYDHRSNVYAKGIGMIQQRYAHFKNSIDCDDGTYDPDQGYEVIYELIEFKE